MLSMTKWKREKGKGKFPFPLPFFDSSKKFPFLNAGLWLYAIYILMIVFFLMNDYLILVLVLDVVMIIISFQVVFKGYVA